MAKRKGVNSRKRQVQRKKKVAGKVRKLAPRTLLLLVIVAALYAVIHSQVITVDKVVATAKNSKLLAVRSVAVKGNKLVAADEIITACGLAGNTGLFEVNGAAVRATLAKNPWIEDVRCVKRFWGKVIIEIRERTPIAMITTGEVQLVDRYGRIMPVESGRQYDLPLVNGLRVKKDSNGNVCVDSAAMQRCNAFLDRAYRRDREFRMIMPQFDMSSSHSVKGYPTDLQTVVEMDYDIETEQLENLKYMLKTLVTRSDVPARINVQYLNLAFVTMDGK